MTVALHAPAKLNLGLRVVGRRADGYHLLETVFHAIELGDRLTAAVNDCGRMGLRIESGGAAVGRGLDIVADDRNLVLRAARAVREAAATDCGVDFYLRKSVPAGAGLGGGSSDAAQALRLTNHLLGDPLDAEALFSLGRQIGADVPFFLRNWATCLGLGIGDELTDLRQIPEIHFVLVLPSEGTETAVVFRNFAPQLQGGPGANNIRSLEVEIPQRIARLDFGPNDLEEAALNSYPRLAKVREAIVDAGFPAVRMSGSGSTFYLGFATAADAGAAARTLRAGSLSAVDGGLQVVTTRSAQLPAVPWVADLPDPRAGRA